jgi:glycine cleavage system H protein
MSSPKDLLFTKSHEWVKVDGEVVTIGVTDYAQSELGDVFGVVESVKAASDVYSPVDGEVVERNEDAIAAPDVVNTSPYGGAWLIKVKLSDPTQVSGLLSPEQYDELLETAGGH